MRAVMYLKLGTGRTKESQITQTKTLREHKLNLYIKHTKYLVWEHQTDVLAGEDGSSTQAKRHTIARFFDVMSFQVETSVMKRLGLRVP